MDKIVNGFFSTKEFLFRLSRWKWSLKLVRFAWVFHKLHPRTYFKPASRACSRKNKFKKKKKIRNFMRSKSQLLNRVNHLFVFDAKNPTREIFRINNIYLNYRFTCRSCFPSNLLTTWLPRGSPVQIYFTRGITRAYAFLLLFRVWIKF